MQLRSRVSEGRMGSFGKHTGRVLARGHTRSASPGIDIGNMDMKKSTKAEILQGLHGLKPVLEERFRVSRIGVFGSVARDRMRADSDIDIVVEMAEPDLFAMVHLKRALEDTFGGPVDLVQYRDGMSAFLKEHIHCCPN